MPQRLLKPTIRQSERWNQLPWFEQSLYIRLITLVDDYGRYEAHPMLLRNEAFPYGDPDGNDVPVERVEAALETLSCGNSPEGMLNLYISDGKKYLQLLRWKERVRSESKYPEMGDDDAENYIISKEAEEMTAECGQMSACCEQMTASPPSPQPTPSPQPSVLQEKINKWFRRRESTKWSDKEKKLLKVVEKLETPPDEIEILEKLYMSNNQYNRRNVETLLNNWNGEIDRARKAFGSQLHKPAEFNPLNPACFPTQRSQAELDAEEDARLRRAMGGSK